MNGWGTDALALACVLASGAVSGVVTVAALERGREERTVCVGEVGAFAMPVIIAVGPEALLRFEEARVELEAARVKSEVARSLLDEALSRELQLEQEREAARRGVATVR